MNFGNLIELISATPISVLSTLAVLILGILYYYLKDRDLPPGPTGLPYIGYWPFIKNEGTHLQMTEMKKKYGDVYSFTVSGRLIIHLGSIKSIKEAHSAKSSCFAERFSDYSMMTLLFEKGVIMANGEEWAALRKFFVQSFREYGLSSVKDYMAGPIYESVNAITENLKDTKGSAFNIIDVINVRSSGILRRMLFNDDQITDEELKSLLEVYQKVLDIFKSKNLLLFGEFARHFLIPRVENYQSAVVAHKTMQEILRKIVKRHHETYNEENIRDIIDSFIKERNVRLQRGDPTGNFFSDEALVSSMIQFIGDGILAVAIFVAYFIHALLEYPDEQEKMYKELVDVIGTDRQITLEDRSKLPYTNAFIQEVLRTTDFMTVFPSLVCTTETTLNGYRIPKGAITLMNMWSSNRDPSVFDNPDEFNPSRYISVPGKPKLESPLMFGIGKRSCAGESFTMMQVFLFLTAIVRNFHLQRPEGYVKSFFIDGVMDVCANPRKQ